MLRADVEAPRKQRHTARGVLARLVDDEHGAEQVPYSTVRDYVARRRLEIAIEAGKQLARGRPTSEALARSSGSGWEVAELRRANEMLNAASSRPSRRPSQPKPTG